MKTNQIFPKALTVFLTLSIIGSMADVVWASSGRTDSNGCHTSKKEGYHCHGSGSSPSTTPNTTPKGTGGSGGLGSVCLTYADCMNRGKIEININADQALNYFQQALILKPNDIEAFTSIHFVEPSVMPILGSCTDYKNCMDLGNLATNQKNYQTGLVNFKRALAFKLGDKYALEAIRNVCRYIQESRTS
ncbi:MAG: YHYH domain-containing protein [Microcoleus sp.]